MAESQFGINLLVALPCTVAKKLLVEKWESGIIYLGMWITIDKVLFRGNIYLLEKLKFGIRKISIVLLKPPTLSP
jgi:hypothetical protein